MPCARPPGAPEARTGSRITPSGSPEEGIEQGSNTGSDWTITQRSGVLPEEEGLRHAG